MARPYRMDLPKGEGPNTQGLGAQMPQGAKPGSNLTKLDGAMTHTAFPTERDTLLSR